jgi:hypothetical protein
LLINFAIAYVAWAFMRVPKVIKKQGCSPVAIRNKSGPEREKVIDDLSRQKLVYAPEKGCFVIRKQIN